MRWPSCHAMKRPWHAVCLEPYTSLQTGCRRPRQGKDVPVPLAVDIDVIGARARRSLASGSIPLLRPPILAGLVLLCLSHRAGRSLTDGISLLRLPRTSSTLRWDALKYTFHDRRPLLPPTSARCFEDMAAHSLFRRLGLKGCPMLQAAGFFLGITSSSFHT